MTGRLATYCTGTRKGCLEHHQSGPTPSKYTSAGRCERELNQPRRPIQFLATSAKTVGEEVISSSLHGDVIKATLLLPATKGGSVLAGGLMVVAE